MHRTLLVGLLALLAATPAQSQESEEQSANKDPWILSVYLSTWINRCDVPSASQASSFTPAIGPSIALSKGPWRLSAAGYVGEYEFEASDFNLVEGQTDPHFAATLPGSTLIQWENESAERRGFTVEGTTTRYDFSAGFGYRFSNAFQLGISLEFNHRYADYATFLPVAVHPSMLPPDFAAAYYTRPVPNDPQGRVTLRTFGGYEIDQYWVGPQVHGFTILTGRLGGFYNASVLALASESRRAPVYLDENGNFFPPGTNQGLQLEKRGFGDNFGTAFSMGVSYSLLPRVAVWGGYSLKFFTEENTFLLDNSLYSGPYFGVGYIFF